jgi:quercetin dioxygenase-like cupin family protein
VLGTMRVRAGVGVVFGLVGVASLWAQDVAVLSGPSKTEPLATVNLAEVGLAGSLTAGSVTIGSGITRPDHTHTGRTSLLVVIQGSLTEVRGAATREYHPGDVVAVGEGVTHHAENHGTVPLIYVEINATANKK